jgi:hypothetical protein
MTRFQRRDGFSALELMVSLPTATVLIGAMSMCVTMMMRAQNQDDTLFRGAYDLSNAASQISSDIESAVSHVSSSATHIELVVPDRDGDRLPEQIRYEWGGTSGTNANKILWKYNQNPLSVIFDDVGAFGLQYTHTLASSSVPNHFRSEVALLSSSDAFTNGVFRELEINSSNGVGQYFIPSVPSTANRWDLGAIRLMLCAADANKDGLLRIRITQANSTSRLPTSRVLAEVQIEEWRLGESYQWLDVPLAPISWQSINTPLCITLTYAGGTGNVARVQFIENGIGMPSNANLITSANGGTSWTAAGSTRDLRFLAYGFYDGYAGRRKFLTNVDLQLISSRSGLQRIDTSIRLPSGPEIP